MSGLVGPMTSVTPMKIALRKRTRPEPWATGMLLYLSRSRSLVTLRWVKKPQSRLLPLTSFHRCVDIFASCKVRRDHLSIYSGIDGMCPNDGFRHPCRTGGTHYYNGIVLSFFESSFVKVMFHPRRREKMIQLCNLESSHWRNGSDFLTINSFGEYQRLTACLRASINKHSSIQTKWWARPFPLTPCATQRCVDVT